MSTSLTHRTPRGTFPLVLAALAGAALGAGLSGDRVGARGDEARPAAPAGGQADAGPRTLSQAFREASRRVRPAVLTITTERAIGREAPPVLEEFVRQFEFMNELLRGGEGRSRPRLERSFGTGFVLDGEGLALTNNHVVAGAARVLARLPGGQEVTAHVIGTDPLSDLAVLRLPPRGDGQPYAAVELGDSRALEVGDWVLAVGNPFGLDQTVTAGVVSAKGRSRVGIAHYEDFIQTDAAINPGNSGGPVLDLSGRVVGVATAIASQSGGYQGIGFAIPIAMTRKVVDDIVKYGRVIRGWLGVALQDASPELLARLGLAGRGGALLSGVVPGSPAEEAGLQPGDFLVALGGRPVVDPTQLSRLAASLPVGEPAALTIVRAGRELGLSVTPIEWPHAAEQEQPTPPADAPATTPDVGITARELTPELALHFGYAPEAQGVVVARVAPGSLAARHGVRPGVILQEIEGRPIETLADLDAARAAGLDPARGVLLRLWDGEYSTYVLLR